MRQGCEQAAEDRALGGDLGTETHLLSGVMGHGGRETETAWQTHPQLCPMWERRPRSPPQLTSTPQPAGAGRQEGEACGVKEGDQNLLYSVSEQPVLGSGHHTDPQILTQVQAVIYPLSGCSICPGRGSTLEAQWPEPGSWVGFVRPTWNFLMNGVSI